MVIFTSAVNGSVVDREPSAGGSAVSAGIDDGCSAAESLAATQLRPWRQSTHPHGDRPR
jgi:hypothetical protein